MNFIPSIQFWLNDVYNKGKIVLALLGEKLFCSFESVFELNRGLRDSQTSINNKDLGLLVKKEAENICKDNIWSSFLRVLALSLLWSVDQFIYFMLLLGFKNIRKSLIKKFIQGKDVTVTNVLSYYGHVSAKKQIIFHWMTILCPYWNYWCLQKINWKKNGHNHREKVGSLCQKCKRKLMTSFLKRIF